MALKWRPICSTAAFIPPASDIETRLRTTKAVTLQSMGLESASTISATFGDLREMAGNGYLGALSEIMRRFPKHFHIFAGEGTVKPIRSHLHSRGVLPRVRFLGHLPDVAPLLGPITSQLPIACCASPPSAQLKYNPCLIAFAWNSVPNASASGLSSSSGK